MAVISPLGRQGQDDFALKMSLQSLFIGLTRLRQGKYPPHEGSKLPGIKQAANLHELRPIRRNR